MFGLRTRSKDVRIIASFVLGLCIFSLMPNEIGYQDIGALLARQSGAAEQAPLDPELQEALNAPRLKEYEPPLASKQAAAPKPSGEVPAAIEAAPRDGFSVKTSTLFFGSSLGTPGSLERWQPGEEPTMV